MTFASMLQALQGQVAIIESGGDHTIPVRAVTDDSRSVQPGSVFIAVRGEQVDGHRFIRAAVEAGMAGLVSQQPVGTLSVP
ncbi:MAG: UDP-N-acetylmuramoyl-L-alanyl-D-glutamate--2,6-diaminopimelate ligase, partial [Nitrospira sp.]|nr:UDP-N-acetylmuramoyl-L-alanyl-D-glutamate--2,6-diaminopimelate ligase [Nitrospira sp.]